MKANFEIISPNGLHARPAAAIARISSGFESSIKIGYESVLVNAKSIMGLLTLAAGQGSRISIEVEGSDEQKAFDALQNLLCEDLAKPIADND